MTRCPDGDARYICHAADFSRKLHVLFPLREASARALAPLLDERVLAYYGPPSALRSNRGHAFVEELVAALRGAVEGGVACANGEGERGAGGGARGAGGTDVVEELVAMLRVERCSADAPDAPVPWLSWLPRIMRSLNRDWHAALRSDGRDAVSVRTLL